MIWKEDISMKTLSNLEEGRKHHGYLNKIIVTYVNGVLTAYFINGIYQIITNS